MIVLTVLYSNCIHCICILYNDNVFKLQTLCTQKADPVSGRFKGGPAPPPFSSEIYHLM
jgi:hypothetical protein